MESRNEVLDNLEFHPLTHDLWSHFETLFGEKGACGGCWCMWWRLKRSEFEKQKGQKNKESMRQIVESGDIPFSLTMITSPLPGAFAYTGFVSAFRAAGFKEVARRSEKRPIMRYELSSR